MSASKILKSVKNYFNLQAAVVDDDYNFAVESAATPARSIGQSIKNYFDLYSEYSAAYKVANEIMLLANAEGVTKGRFDSSSTTVKSGLSYTENAFKLKLEKNGRVLLKCDATFAKKVKKLPSVSDVKEISQDDTAAPAPKTDAPKQ